LCLQFVTYPVSSPERNALIPVLGTLLQFTPTEMAAANASATVWSKPRVAKEVKIIQSNSPVRSASISNTSFS
jgi:hypothetical protein